MAHTHEKMCFTAEVFIVHKNKVLLRKHDKYKKWLSVGGHIELGEDPNEAALREVKEEVGLEVKLWDGNRLDTGRFTSTELVPPIAINRHRVSISGAHEHVTLVFLASSETETIAPQHDGDRSDECRWVTKEELKGLELEPPIRAYANFALDMLGASDDRMPP